MEYILWAMAGVFGLLIGSFLNVCIYRIPRNESISFPPSHCTNCDNRIKAYDLIPVISYIILGGKCRHCGEKISMRYPVVEFTNMVMYLLIFYKFGMSIETIIYSILMSVLIVIGLIDYDFKVIPNRLNIFIFILWVIYVIISIMMKNNVNIVDSLIGAVVGGGIYLLISIVGVMGGGDIKMMAALGLFLGLELTLVSILLAFVVGGIISVLLIALKIKNRKDTIAFGPFIIIGTVLSLFFGSEIINLLFSI